MQNSHDPDKKRRRAQGQKPSRALRRRLNILHKQTTTAVCVISRQQRHVSTNMHENRHSGGCGGIQLGAKIWPREGCLGMEWLE